MFFFLLTVYNKVLILSLDIFFNFTQCFKIIRLYQRKPLTPADTFVINFPPHSESWYLTTLSAPPSLYTALIPKEFIYGPALSSGRSRSSKNNSLLSKAIKKQLKDTPTGGCSLSVQLETSLYNERED